MRLFNLAAPIAVAGVLLLAPAHAQQPPAPSKPNPSQTMPQRGGMMDHAKMMADMKEADARLEALSAKMKAAQGPEKIQAMQDVVSELVKNQLDMHHHMSMMHENMMSQTPHK